MIGKFSFSKKVATGLSALSIAATIFFGSMSSANATINYGEEVTAVAHNFVGSPYKYGGTTPKGFDASGFTQYIFKNSATNLTIPRTCTSQFKIGKAINQDSLNIGDLVFYATGTDHKESFVGIYNGDGTFIGSTSKGVKVIKMNDKYWKDRYVGAKRIIE
jgi:cell wall-associated NlpC family hydrolase